MFRNYLTTAVRNLLRNRLHTAIGVGGLAIGFAAALLIALFVRDQSSYENWMPDHQRVHLLTTRFTLPGHATVNSHFTSFQFADALKADFSEIEAAARVGSEEVSLRGGEVEARETIFWADATLFDVLALPILAGDTIAALAAPDGLVLTRRMARKYFGRDAPIGEVLDIDRTHPMRVLAIIDDLPSNTYLATEIIGSGRAPFSAFAETVANPPAAHLWKSDGWTFLKLDAQASAEKLEREMPTFLDRRMKPAVGALAMVEMSLTPMSAVHFQPSDDKLAMKPTDDPTTVFALGIVGLLILTVAIINFINLMTARATHRAVEVGVRKTTGATRPNLIVQFLGESILNAAVAGVTALGLTALLLPAFNGFLDHHIPFDINGGFALAVATTVVVVGILAGFYPAFLLSFFRPSAVLKGAMLPASGSGRLRQALVIVQFAVLIALMAATGIVYRQSVFALEQGLRFNKDEILLVQTTCSGSFPDQVRALPGVRAAACSQRNGANLGEALLPMKRNGQEIDPLAFNPIDVGYFDVLGLRPVAGRFFDSTTSATPFDFGKPGTYGVVINETAVRRMGFASPQAAIGQILTPDVPGALGFEVIGVVPDFSFDTVHRSISPGLYLYAPSIFRWLNIKLNGQDVPGTLAAVDALWKKVGEPRAITRLFLDREVQNLYRDITRASQLLTVFAGVGTFIASLGLLGLATFIAESRTKEIGIRKAMGASRANVLRMFLWQFAKPVLWANIFAWPVVYVAMRRWLEGFAYHIDLSPWIFLAASALALVVAMATVIGHVILVSRAQPVTALRHE